MDNKSKKCFCCGNELKDNEQICSKCGAVIPIEIDPVAYERNRKTLKWSAIVGLIVGFFTALLFGSIDPNSYLFLIGVLLGLGSAYLTSVCFDKYYKSQDATPASKASYCPTTSSREEKWIAQEKVDKMILNRGDALANQMLLAISSINAMWDCDTHLDKENKNAEFRSKVYLLAITPELFLANYFLFKAGNHDDIKDSIYIERPYLVLETLIKMGLFIFETKNNIFVLKEIINGDKEEYIGCKVLAQRILNDELLNMEEFVNGVSKARKTPEQKIQRINCATNESKTAIIINESEKEFKIKCRSCEEDLSFMGYEDSETVDCPFCNTENIIKYKDK